MKRKRLQREDAPELVQKRTGVNMKPIARREGWTEKSIPFHLRPHTNSRRASISHQLRISLLQTYKPLLASYAGCRALHRRGLLSDRQMEAARRQFSLPPFVLRGTPMAALDVYYREEIKAARAKVKRVRRT